ncbi:hypothetical protein D3C76_425400 [compost metagenome]|jgi:hypothetical protein|uniref:DUF4189 domain-containing protein n=2 Tax=Pseudomonas TaxID=286 RepID=A0A231FY72_PSEJE|nr:MULTISPECIES: hypothetical protein [Pseudomonas]MBV7491222.1 hypothetical protein [Pseudomonas sp. PDM30]OXR29314.1 hypothetical protein PSJE_26830 [Pseudomonas jessenii]SEC50470.1 hypothetical protein SAMN04490187_4625 [Pseudomonas jessenii]VVQ18798.1 hypothetical protein PS922_05800 [Pseudomonas fluorescens]
MTGHTVRQCSSWILLSLLAVDLALIAGCSGKASTAQYSAPSVGSTCYAKALPTVGEGGLAWGDTLDMARQKSLSNCIRYSGRSGGTPSTCKVVMAECKH